MKKNKGIITIILSAIIILILSIAGVGIFIITQRGNLKNNDNISQEVKEEQKNNKIFYGDYEIFYDISEISQPYWDSKNEINPMATNREFFYNRYMFHVEGESSSSYGGNLAMPLKPDYTMYYRVYKGGGAEKTCEYFLKVDFNKEHIFYPNMMIGTLEGGSDRVFTFSLLDSYMNFNNITGNFRHLMKTTKMQSENKSNYKLLYEDNEWAFFEITSNSEKTIIYADYYVDLENYDYINFEIKLNGKLKEDDVNELINKIKNNIQISKIEDDYTCNYLSYISHYYLELNNQDQRIDVSKHFILDMKNVEFRVWTSIEDRTGITSTNNTNMVQWDDLDWRNGFGRISLLEYPGALDKGIENVISDCFGTDVESK